MASTAESAPSKNDTLQMAADIVAAYVSNNTLPVNQLSEAITTVHRALMGVQSSDHVTQEKNSKPAVAINRSIKPDYIICLEDGRRLKMLKRHLRTRYGMTPDQYRLKWGLPVDYPMVAPNYSAQRSDFAKKIGLGQKAKGRKPKKRK